MELERPADNEPSTTERLIRGRRAAELRPAALQLNLTPLLSNSIRVRRSMEQRVRTALLQDMYTNYSMT